MLIVEDKIFKQDLLNQIQAREFSLREGTHCSDLIYCLNKQVLRRIKPLPTDEHEILLFSLGWSSQRWLTGRDADEPTLTVDGIQVTLDALWLGDPWELKATFQSSERPIEENDSWLHQIMAQCYVKKTLTARLSRLELMGNWRSIFGKKEEKALPENQKPTLHGYKFTFTQEELDDNWTWLQSRKKIFETLLTQPLFKTLPKKVALPPNHEYECGYCPKPYREPCECTDSSST